MRSIIARPASDDRAAQTVLEHLEETADYARDFAGKCELSSAGELLGLLHDFGKNGDRFQKYIREVDVDKKGGTIQLLEHSCCGRSWHGPRIKRLDVIFRF